MKFRHAAFALIALCLLIVAVMAGQRTPVHADATFPRRNLSLLSSQQLDSALVFAAKLPFSQRIALWADLAAIDSVYVADPLGEGAGSTPDADPLFDFAQVDCVTYVEQVYALALSQNRAQFDETLRRIRYRDGQVDFRWRNHYAVSDWLPANAWFITDITGAIAGDRAKTMSKTISRGKFFAGKGVPQYANLPDEAATTLYIPRDRVNEIAGSLNTGDMAIFVISNPGIIAGHVGIIRIERDVVYVQHASVSEKKVVKSPLPDYVTHLPNRFVGLKIARPAEITPPVK